MSPEEQQQNLKNRAHFETLTQKLAAGMLLRDLYGVPLVRHSTKDAQTGSKIPKVTFQLVFPLSAKRNFNTPACQQPSWCVEDTRDSGSKQAHESHVFSVIVTAP